MALVFVTVMVPAGAENESERLVATVAISSLVLVFIVFSWLGLALRLPA